MIKPKTICINLHRTLELARHQAVCIALHTLHNGEQNDDDEEEEADIEQHSSVFQRVSIGRFQLVTDTSSSSHTGVEVIDEALEREEKTKGKWSEVIHILLS